MWRRIVFIIFVFSCYLLVSAQDAPPPPDYFVEAFVDNPTPYIGQQIAYTFIFYNAVGSAQPQYEPPDFEGFWQVADEQAESNAQQINGRQYIVSELRTALFPTVAGNIIIEPSRVVLPETVYRPAEETFTQPITVQVKLLPDGAPEGFGGAVGQFDLSATLDRQAAPLGEPISLKLNISGTGNVEQVILPDLDVPSAWNVYSNTTTFRTTLMDGRIVGEKNYEYLLIPNQVGLHTLPPIALIYFDPDSAAYRSVSTTPVTLEVTPGDSLATLEIESHPIALTLKPIPASIQPQSILPELSFWGIWLLPPLGVLGCIGIAIRRERQRRQLNLRRHSHALQEAERRLLAAKKAPVLKGFALLRMAIVGYLADKLALSEEKINYSDWRSFLEKAPVSAALKEKLFVSIEWVDEGQYAPVVSFDFQTLCNRIGELLREVDEAWMSS
jgi:hypothetical protein